jgi:membrane-associated phospholipid phosphatase
VKRRLLHPHGVVLVTTSAFIALSLAVLLLQAVPFDAVLRDAVLALASPAVVAAMRVLTHLGDAWFLLPALGILFAVVPEARARWWLWLGLLLISLVAEPVKYVVARPRPEALSFGYPSGHATTAAAFFGALMYLAGGFRPAARTTLRFVAPLLIIVVALSRVMLRKHWPSDVVAGIALGLALAATAAIIAESREPDAPDPAG